MKPSLEEFLEWYARVWGTTVEELLKDAEPRECLDCEWPTCKGWILVLKHEDKPPPETPAP